MAFNAIRDVRADTLPSSLRSLDVTGNDIRSLSTVGLTRLERLGVSLNPLEPDFVHVDTSVSLVDLDIIQPHWQSLPTWIGLLKRLRKISVWAECADSDAVLASLCTDSLECVYVVVDSLGQAQVSADLMALPCSKVRTVCVCVCVCVCGDSTRA